MATIEEWALETKLAAHDEAMKDGDVPWYHSPYAFCDQSNYMIDGIELERDRKRLSALRSEVAWKPAGRESG